MSMASNLLRLAVLPRADPEETDMAKGARHIPILDYVEVTVWKWSFAIVEQHCAELAAALGPLSPGDYKHANAEQI
ncbi:MAG: hypothetical protein AAGF44_01500 [Pseudomonadota bacterium]